MSTLQELFADASRWTQGEMARDEHGEGCDTPDGACVCLVGGVQKLYDTSEKRREVLGKLEAAAEKLYHYDDLIDINDTLGLEAVRAICKEANV